MKINCKCGNIIYVQDTSRGNVFCPRCHSQVKVLSNQFQFEAKEEEDIISSSASKPKTTRTEEKRPTAKTSKKSSSKGTHKTKPKAPVAHKKFSWGLTIILLVVIGIAFLGGYYLIKGELPFIYKDSPTSSIAMNPHDRSNGYTFSTDNGKGRNIPDSDRGTTSEPNNSSGRDNTGSGNRTWIDKKLEACQLFDNTVKWHKGLQSEIANLKTDMANKGKNDDSEAKEVLEDAQTKDKELILMTSQAERNIGRGETNAALAVLEPYRSLNSSSHPLPKLRKTRERITGEKVVFSDDSNRLTQTGYSNPNYHQSGVNSYQTSNQTRTGTTYTASNTGSTDTGTNKGTTYTGGTDTRNNNGTATPTPQTSYSGEVGPWYPPLRKDVEELAHICRGSEKKLWGFAANSYFGKVNQSCILILGYPAKLDYLDSLLRKARDSGQDVSQIISQKKEKSLSLSGREGAEALETYIRTHTVIIEDITDEMNKLRQAIPTLAAEANGDKVGDRNLRAVHHPMMSIRRKFDRAYEKLEGLLIHITMK